MIRCRPGIPRHLRKSPPAVAASGGGGDPYFNSVVLLAINDNKGNGTTSFADQSNSAHTLNTGGSAKYDTSTAPTGMTSSGSFPTSSDTLNSTASNDFAFPADFTVEAFVNTTSFASNPTLINIGATDQFVFGILTTGKLYYFDGGVRTLGANTLTLSTWSHIAYVRSGTTLTGYIDGVAGATPYTVGTTVGGNLALTIALDGAGGATLHGHCCSLRLTKGVARYTANFTPPSLPFPTS